MTVKERIAYIQGLIEGADAFAAEPRLRGIVENLIEVCQGLADEVDRLRARHDDVQAYLDAVDDDLADLEEQWHEHAGEHDEDDESYVEMQCPKCGEDVYFDEAFLDDEDVEVSCPECGEIVYSAEVAEDLEELEDAAEADGAGTLAPGGDNHRS